MEIGYKKGNRKTMTVTEMRNKLGLSRAAFSRKYKIPIRTLENWEAGKNQCPEYVLALLERAVNEDHLEVLATDRKCLGAMKYTHYGKEILVQTLDHNFEKDLKKSGIVYTVLPVLAHKILRYTIQKKIRYAFIHPLNVLEEYREDVYLMDSIPDDMNMDNLINDCVSQANGEDPMVLPTRARIMYDKALELLYNDSSRQKKSFLEWLDWKPEEREINYALISLGSSMKELLESDHHDVPELDQYEVDDAVMK